MGNCQHDSCNSRSSHHRDELLSMLNLCVKILKEKICCFDDNKIQKKFIFLEASYTFLNNTLQILLQGPKISTDSYEKIKERLSNLAGYLIIQKGSKAKANDPFFEENNMNTFQKTLSEIQDVMKLKDFNEFSLQSQEETMKELESFANQKEKLLEDFSLINAEKLWHDRFSSVNEVEWNDFYLNFKDELQKSMKEEITPEMLLTLKATLDINNNLKVDRYGWNEFYLKVYSDWSEMKNFVKNSMLGSVYLKNSIFLMYISTPGDKKMMEFYFQTPTTFEISDEGIVSPKEFKVKKNLNERPLTFGRDNNGEEGDVIFHKNLKEVNKNHFQIITKYILDQNTSSFFQTEFYLNNLSKESPILFIVEEKGYVLCENSMLWLKNDVKILIKSLTPTFSTIDKKKYFYVDSNLERRKSMKRRKFFYENPSIFLQVQNGNEKIEKAFNVYNEISDFQIIIGNAFSNDFTIPKAEPEHCSIHYSAYDKIWYVVDLKKEKNNYRTFLFPFEKGVKLCNEMKFSMNGHIFEVKDLL